jgi:ABC-type transporter Mla subunit MlaD
MLKPRARDRLFKRAVGLFVLTSALVLVFVLRMYQQAAGPFDDSIRLLAVAPRADGLEVDSPVTMYGVKIGRVVGIAVTPEQNVKLEFEVQGRYRDKVRGDSKATLSRPLIGSAFIDISMGTPAKAQLAPGASIELTRVPDINDVVAGIPQKLEKVDTVLANVAVASDEFKTLARKVAASGGPVDNSLANAEKITREAAEAATKVNHALSKAQPAVDDAVKAAAQVNAILADVKQGTARVDGLTQKTDAILSNAEALSADLKNQAPPLIRDVGQQVSPILDAGRDALTEADDVLRAAKNSFLLRGSIPPPPPGPLAPPTQ